MDRGLATLFGGIAKKKRTVRVPLWGEGEEATQAVRCGS
jgi:hypothetical protein